MTDINGKLFWALKEEKRKRLEILDEGDRRKEANLLNISNTLDDYYFFSKLKLYCEYLSYQNIVGKELVQYEAQDFRLLEAVLTIIQNEYLESSDVFNIYWNFKELYERFEVDQHELFYNTLKRIEKIVAELDEEDISEVFSFLSNYCIRKINDGNETYLENLLYINIEIINALYSLDSNRHLLPALFLNSIKTALRIENDAFFNTLNSKDISSHLSFKNRLEWTGKFIEVYAPTLSDKQKNILYHYTLALLEFERKDFEKAHQILKNIERKKGLFINLNIKKIFIQIQFERFENRDSKLAAFSELQTGLEAYRGSIKHYKSKPKLNYQLQLHDDFYKLCQKLFNLYKKNGFAYKNAAYHQKRTDLEEEIKQLKNNPHQNWLLEKVQSL